MNKFARITICILICCPLIGIFPSCINTQKIAYFNDVKDSTLISSQSGLEPVIQKKDILSISVSSLSREATILFNMPNLPITPAQPSTNTTPETAGYLVNQDGFIQFPILGEISAAGLTQKQLQTNITKLLVEKKLLFDPIVTVRFLNFRVTVLGEVNRPGVVTVPGEQISILEAIGQAGDLTIYGLRDNIILIRQVGMDKLVKRLNLNSSEILKSPYFFLKSNDVLYVEPGKNKVASTGRAQQILPIVFSGLSVIIIVLTNLLKL
ncbi:MAG: polysaccharide biosynthesis/export family protein [Bacteroidota bacterium]|nr:polysaccharide biosynthesis/export family protein [Bacteroidota bacterium]